MVSEAQTIPTDPKWIRTKADEQAVNDGCWFDVAAGERVCAFFEKVLKHSEGQWAGEPFELMEWERNDVLMPLFGWKRANGTRRFRRGYVEIPKKNGKSAIASGVALYLLVGDNEPGAEVYCAASDRQQASIVFNAAAAMVRKSSVLSKRLEVHRSTKTISYLSEGSTYRALSADAGSNEGLKIHGLIFDELHTQKNRDLFDALTYGGAARRQPLLFAITTAGVYDPESVCWLEHDYATKVRDGILPDTSYFTYIRSADKDDDWADEKTWFKANPSLGVTITLESFREDFQKARNSPAQENAFRRYRLNQWVQQETRWLQIEKWDACNAHPLTAGEVSRRTWTLGVDLSSKIDLTALVAVSNEDENHEIAVKCWFFMPEDRAVEREKEDRVPYTAWARAGLVELTPGNVVDYDFVEARTKEIIRELHINEVCFDPWNAQQFANHIQGSGTTCIEVRQGYATLSEPTKVLERLVVAGKLRHGGNPVLRWMASNVAVDIDPAGNIKPSKAKSTQRIDGIAALVTAMSRGVRVGVTTSVYDSSDRKEGLLVL